jgi:hypothetical protein
MAQVFKIVLRQIARTPEKDPEANQPPGPFFFALS